VVPISAADPQGPPHQAAIVQIAKDVERLAGMVSSVVVAPERTIRLALTGLFAQGHVLLEDLPGVGKTLIGKTIARSIACDFKRIQFTPDLLPSDVTGTSVFDMRATEFNFIPGPIFANVVLADEINRAGPRTQSALLEAMAEFQVSVDGEVRPLPRPFLVIATQNFAESHGTFPLPDSQKDRFMVSLGIGLPSAEDEVEILERSMHGMPEASPVIASRRVIEIQESIKTIEVSRPLREYIVNFARATRRHPAAHSGLSPRGSAALQRASQCWAAFNGRSFVTPEDVADIAGSVVAHRLMMAPGAGVSPVEVVAEALDSTPVPA
jgi:MoxR-like ATPase